MAIAATRVFVFSAGFPIYGNVDEAAHFDLIKKYARGYLPREPIEYFDEESGLQIALYGSSEYFRTTEQLKGTIYEVPLWKQPQERVRQHLAQRVAQWRARANHEAHAPPVYYAIAGGWYKLGEALGMKGGQLSYFVRFLNIPFFVLLVWLAYQFARSWFPDHREVRLGVPLLLAFFPQDLFYAMTSDSLSAAFSLASLMMMMRWRYEAEPTFALSVATGLIVALTFLVKFSNIATPLVFGIVLLLKARCWAREQQWGEFTRTLPVICFAALVPVGLWLGRTFMHLGNLTGMDSNIETVRYGVRPLGQYIHHKIFTLDGFWYFWDQTIKSLWRGEFAWGLEQLNMASADTFYIASSTFLLVSAAAFGVRGWRGRRTAGSSAPPRTNAETITPFLWASFVLSMLFLAATSVSLDFSDSYYPNETHPYFVSGRLISGALVPFLSLYILGASYWLRPRFREGGTIVFLAATAVVMLASEVVINRDVFQSVFNWFHL